VLTSLLVWGAVAVDAYPNTAPGQPAQLFGQFPVGEALHGHVDPDLGRVQHQHLASSEIRRRRIQQNWARVSYMRRERRLSGS